MLNNNIRLTVTQLAYSISGWIADSVEVYIYQEGNVLFQYHLEEDDILKPNASRTISSGKDVRVQVVGMSVEQRLEMTADGQERELYFTKSFINTETLTLKYKIEMVDGYGILGADANQPLLSTTPPYTVTISNQPPGNPLDNCFFYEDEAIVLLSELEAREKSVSVIGSDDFGIDDIFKDLIDHYKYKLVDPFEVIDPRPGPDDYREKDDIWNDVLNAAQEQAGVNRTVNPVFAEIASDPATILSVGGVSYIKEGDVAVAMGKTTAAANTVRSFTGSTLNSNYTASTNTAATPYTNVFPGTGAVSRGTSYSDFLSPGSTKKITEKKYVFKMHAHTRTDELIQILSYGGLEKLLTRDSQNFSDTLDFINSYRPNADLFFLEKQDIPQNIVAFDFGGAYSQYNWELFFHIPMTIAGKLSSDQKFEQAQKWYHYIFDPTSSESGNKDRFWQFLPFYQEAGKEIKTLNELLADGEEIMKQIELWEKYPFKPHVIARMRISAYMKNVVMKYLDNIIRWADNLFMRDTLEAINEAANLYILAAKILGPKPQRIPSRAEPVDQTYNTLRDEKWQVLSNALVEIEHFIPPSSGSSWSLGSINGHIGAKPVETMLYFGLIRNEKLLGYWDTIADRLFKIRHSMNIKGVERTLALFEPPIDPALLVKAAAAGLDLGAILSEVAGISRSNYRFSTMIQKARQFAEELRIIGQNLLSTIEKEDAEELALLRQSLDGGILEAVKEIKEANVQETARRIEEVTKSLDGATERRDFYSSRVLTNDYEKSYLDSLDKALSDIETQKITETIASVVAAIPDFKIGAPTSVGTTFGGTNLAKATMAIASYYSGGVGQSNIEGAKASAMGGYTRRLDDWQIQTKSAVKEVEQIEKEKLICEIRKEIAQNELDIHVKQIENSNEITDFMTGKFTSTELYDWLIGEISGIYFQSYKLAVNMAKKAESCYRQELADESASFIGYGYWDSLRKGLMAADRLVSDINYMESNYLDNNARNEFELTKHISLGLLDPVQLLELKNKGMATFNVPEILFDLDYPGHYLRRIKSVSVSLHCVTGPFTTVNATLRLKKHYTRSKLDSIPGGFYNVADSEYKTSLESIATSSAQNDSGLFQLNFNDERYLPFEGCGAVGQWEIELVKDKSLRQFDYNTISDVVLHMKYTARENSAVKDALITAMKNELQKITGTTMTLYTYISARNEFLGEWYSFCHPQTGSSATLNIPLGSSAFPFVARSNKINIKSIGLHARINTDKDVVFELQFHKNGTVVKQDVTLPFVPGKPLMENDVDISDNLYLAIPEGILFKLTLKSAIPAENLKDFILTVQYVIEQNV